MALLFSSEIIVKVFTLLLILATGSRDFALAQLDSIQSENNISTMSTSAKIFACNFEVFGRVQGVFFRKYTAQQATNLGVRGWCMNTKGGTVMGELEAPLEKLNAMKDWLRTEGSPSSTIEKAEFTSSKEINSYTFKNFTIRR